MRTESVESVAICVGLIAASFAAYGFYRGFCANPDGWISFSGSIIGGVLTIIAAWIAWQAVKNQNAITLESLIASDEDAFFRDGHTGRDYAAIVSEARMCTSQILEDWRKTKNLDEAKINAMAVQDCLIRVSGISNRYIRWQFSYELARVAELSGAIRDRGVGRQHLTSLAEYERLLRDCDRCLGAIQSKLNRIMPTPGSPGEWGQRRR